MMIKNWRLQASVVWALVLVPICVCPAPKAHSVCVSLCVSDGSIPVRPGPVPPSRVALCSARARGSIFLALSPLCLSPRRARPSSSSLPRISVRGRGTPLPAAAPPASSCRAGRVGRVLLDLLAARRSPCLSFPLLVGSCCAATTASCLLVRRRSSPPAARSPWCSCPILSAASALSPCPSSPVASQCRIALRLWLSALVQSSWLASRALLVLSRSRLCPLWSPRGGSVACASSLAGAGALVFCGLRCGCLGTFRFNFRANPQACGPLSDGLQREAPSRTPAGVPRTRSYAGKLMPP